MSWVERLNDSSSTWGEALLRASWQGAALALVAWIVCRLWKRMPPGVHCAIWLLVCLKMLVGLFPVALALPLLPPEKPMVLDFSFMESNSTLASYEAVALPRPSLSIGSYALIAWLLGLAGVLFGVAFALHKVKRKLTQGQPLEDLAIQELAKKVGLRRVPQVLLTEAGEGVLTIGAFRPVILISKSTLERCTPDEFQLVLAHELAHIKRGDAWLALLPQFATALFFFHPAAWIVSREFELAREAACDEIAIRSLEARSDVFGRLLLKLSSQKEPGASLFVLGISSHFKVLSRRISMLNHSSSRPASRRLFVLVAVIGTALVLPWNLVRAQAPQQVQPDLPIKRPNAMPVKAAIQASKPTQVKKKRKGSAAPEYVIFQLKNAKAAEVAKALNQRPEYKHFKFSSNDRHNMLIVSGPYEKVKPLLSEVKAFEKKAPASKPKTGAPKPEAAKLSPNATKPETGIPFQHEQDTRTVHQLPIQHQAVTEIAKKLDQEFGSKFPEGKLRILSETRTNTLVLQATSSIADEVMARARALDQPKPAASTAPKILKRLMIKHIDAKAAYLKIKEQLPRDTTIDFFSYDPTDNSLIVRGSEAEVTSLQDIVAMIDQKD